MKRRILSEKKGVVILFMMVLVIFSLAQNDTQNIDKIYPNNVPTVTIPDHNLSPVTELKKAEQNTVEPGAFQ